MIVEDPGHLVTRILHDHVCAGRRRLGSGGT